MLIAQATFSGCATAPSAPSADIEEIKAALVPPMPVLPAMEPVAFEDRDGGLWLSYEDYRALERNVIALREYAARLEVIVGFYKGE